MAHPEDWMESGKLSTFQRRRPGDEVTDTTKREIERTRKAIHEYERIIAILKARGSP
jgi:hypothetical protein